MANVESNLSHYLGRTTSASSSCFDGFRHE